MSDFVGCGRREWRGGGSLSRRGPKDIARRGIQMLQDGCELRINEQMQPGQLTRMSPLPREGAPSQEMPHSRKQHFFPFAGGSFTPTGVAAKRPGIVL